MSQSLSGMKAWVSPPGEEPRPVEGLAGSGGGAEWTGRT